MFHTQTEMRRSCCVNSSLESNLWLAYCQMQEEERINAWVHLGALTSEREEIEISKFRDLLCQV